LSPDWQIYVSDMLERCERILAYCAELSRAEFGERGLVYDATVRNIELLGEAARHIPEQERTLASGIDWRSIIAMRNILVHGYLGIDDDILWDVIRHRVPELQRELREFRARLAAS
jgi:uncharacterized protein with HEPN domain